MKSIYRSTQGIGSLSLKRCAEIFELFRKFILYPDNPIKSLHYFQMGQEDDKRGACFFKVISDENLYDTSPSWSVSLDYVLTYKENFDIEAYYKVSKSTEYKMRPPEFHKGRFQLSEVRINKGTEDRFIELANLLCTLERETETLKAWAISSRGMIAACNDYCCEKRKFPKFFSPSHIIEFSSRFSTVAELKQKMRCTKCSRVDPDLYPTPPTQRVG